jgi:hypothetical protein
MPAPDAIAAPWKASSAGERSPSAESAAPVHGCFEVPYPAARVSLFGFAAGSTDRTDAAAIKRLIATRPAVPRCDRIVGQPGVPACVAYVNRSVDVYLRGRRGLDIELGRHRRDLTPAEPPIRSFDLLARHLGEVRSDQDCLSLRRRPTVVSWPSPTVLPLPERQ